MNNDDDMNFEGKFLKRRWKIQRKLGTGAYGMVFLGLDVKTNQSVAIKIEENKNNEKLTNEARIIKTLNRSE